MASVQSTTPTSKPGTAQPGAFADAVQVHLSGGIPDSPPDEVLDAMGVAANAHDRLAAEDRGLSFKIDDQTGKVFVTVHDANGNALFTVPASKALDIASGGSLE
jgi:flagellar protein FlaG